MRRTFLLVAVLIVFSTGCSERGDAELNKLLSNNLPCKLNESSLYKKHITADIKKTDINFKFRKAREYQLLHTHIALNGTITHKIITFNIQNAGDEDDITLKEKGWHILAFCAKKKFPVFKKWTRLHVDRLKTFKELLKNNTEKVSFKKTENGNEQVMATVDDETMNLLDPNA